MSRGYYAVLGLFVGAIGVGLCFLWFDWKLFTVLFLMFYGNNMSEGSQR